MEHMKAKVGSNLKSVQHDHESLRELINENIFGDQIALQIDFQFSSIYRLLSCMQESRDA